MSVSIVGGYECLSVVQLCSVLDAVERKEIRYGAFRTFFAAVSMLATRNAAQRVKGDKTPVTFEKEELRVLTQSSSREVRADIAALAKAKLLHFSQSAIVLGNDFPEGDKERSQEAAGQGRSLRRLIPVPRRILRWLAQCSQPSVAKTVIAYMLRGLTRHRNGSINACGAVKSSWIANVAGISLRSAKAARRRLIEIGWLNEDNNSTQRKLNRTGAYFTINLECNMQPEAQVIPTPISGFEINRGQESSESAPPPPKKSSESAPPNKEIETPSDIKNQKPSQSGVFQKPEGGGGEHPHLNNIQPEDITRLSRLLELYQQAIAQGWLKDSEANRLFFVAAAVRVKQTPSRNPVRAFVGIVRQNLRSHITQEQEEHARKILIRYRGGSLSKLASRGLEKTQAPKIKMSNLVANVLEKLML